ncbi:hypothetical protein [Kribbella qitaiheensis]|uniref:hypothetical protein n=1 Tax=Kribbella qitaiheensis TaxID=1544730 RepID=UPI00162A6A42|nr:hypothetical protein [Kribbella qitaiheensis]
MDANDLRPDAQDQAPDPVDPIGPPELPKMSRHSLRALALAGVAVGAPMLAFIYETSTGTPTTRY